MGGGERGNPWFAGSTLRRSVFPARPLNTYLSADTPITHMHRAFVPPSGEMTQEPADTRPPSIWKKARVAVFGAGTIRDKVGFPYVMWGKKRR